MKKFLLINPFGIGDVLFTTPVISNIKDSYPDSFIGYWCNERVEDILKNNRKIDKIFALSRGDIKKIYYKSKWEGIRRSFNLYRQLQKGRFDISLDYSLDHRYGFISKLTGIKRRVGFNYKNRGRFLTDKLDLGGYSHKHVVEYYLDLLKFINIEPKINKLDLSVPETGKIKARGILAGFGISDKDLPRPCAQGRGLIIAIAPGAGASWGKDASLKHWPAIKFARLADKLIGDFGAKVLILGDAPERPIADTIINAMHNQAVDLVGKTGLGDLIAIINNLQVLVTNDGGPLHIAVALGKKTVSFFGPVDPKVYGPYPTDENCHIILTKNLDCSPCYNKFRLSGCLRNKECLETIDVQQALDAIKRFL